MVYEPRKQNGKPFIIVLCICIVLFSVFFAFSSLSDKEEVEVYQIGTLSAEKTKEVLETKAEESYIFQDYFFYGESLNVLKATYNPEINDEICGKSIILKDLCTGKEMAFVVGTTIDSAILLNHLKEGFYEVYVVE